MCGGVNRLLTPSPYYPASGNLLPNLFKDISFHFGGKEFASSLSLQTVPMYEACLDVSELTNSCMFTCGARFEVDQPFHLMSQTGL